MKKLTFLSLIIAIAFGSFAQKNMVFRDSLQYTQSINDVWGYADTLGNEYAIIGVQTGISIVDVSNPDSIFELFWVPGVNSGWRDMVTWNKHAYVTNETSGGLLIIDLSTLPDSIDTTYYTGAGLTEAHNIFIDENGIAYVFGSNVGVGGALFLDLSDPENPDSIGIYNTGYLHDGYVRGDILYGAEINNGFLSIIDISDKTSPSILGTVTTPNAFTHNVWLSDNSQFAFTTDEKSGAYVTAYDVSTPSSITETDRYHSNDGSGVIPHNTHVKNDYLITSFYRDGCTIVDADRPGNMIEVGFYDTHPSSGNGFQGAWGTYPFLPSGNILVSDRSEGLFVLTPTYIRGCYLEGIVKNAITNIALSSISITVKPDSVQERTSVSGEYVIGIADSALYDLCFEKTGYFTKNISNVRLDNGILTIMDIKLIPDTVSSCNVTSSFSATDSNICQGDSIVFTNTSTNSIGYEWYYDSIFLSQDTNVTMIFPDSGTHELMLIADKGICEDTSVLMINVNYSSTITWTGDINTAYNNPGNWDPNVVPTECNSVIIPGTAGAPNQPHLTTSEQVKEIEIKSSQSARLTISGSGMLTTNK